MKFAALLLLAAVGCTNARLVAKVGASEQYYAASYQHKCQGTGNPPAACKPCQAILNDGIWKAQVADANLKIGYLPPAEIVELDELLDSLAQCP